MKKIFKLSVTLIITLTIGAASTYLLHMAKIHAPWLYAAVSALVVLFFAYALAVNIHHKIWRQKNGR